MKFYITAVLVAVGSQAIGQTAKLEEFSRSTSSDFELLVPDMAAENATALPQAEQSVPEYEREAGLVVDLGPAGRRSPLVDVPTWMRRGHAASLPDLIPSTSASPDPGCITEDYFPRYDLGELAQVRRRLYFHQVLAAACEAGVPARLFDALVVRESRYHRFARSPAGAMGMAQLMPGTARDLGVSDPWNPVANLRGGARYLREQFDRYGSWKLALAAYNAGPGNVDKHGGIPPFAETRRYVQSILASLDGGPAALGALSRPTHENPFRRVDLVAFTGSLDSPED